MYKLTAINNQQRKKKTKQDEEGVFHIKKKQRMEGCKKLHRRKGEPAGQCNMSGIRRRLTQCKGGQIKLVGIFRKSVTCSNANFNV